MMPQLFLAFLLGQCTQGVPTSFIRTSPTLTATESVRWTTRGGGKHTLMRVEKEGRSFEQKKTQASESKYHIVVKEVNMLSELVMKQRIDRLNISDDLECDAWRSCKEKCVTDVSSGNLHFRMTVLHNDMYISRTPLCTGEVWEADTVKKFLSFLGQSKKGNFLDVGANLGSFSLPVGAFMKKRGEGVVLAVEANPDAATILQESVSVNQFSEVVIPHSVALVRDALEKQHVCMSVENTLQSGNPGGNQVDLGKRDFGDCGRKIETTTLDKLYEAEPALMSQLLVAKLDCEGCEGQALFGARQLLREHPPCLLAFEVTEKYLCEGRTALVDIYKLLEEMGYDTTGHPGPQPHGDGSCKGFENWASANPENAFVQSFAMIPQRDMQACLSRFN